jgi:hypothetical protein
MQLKPTIMAPEEGKQEDVDAYKKGRQGESDAGLFSGPSESNVEGQKDKADADESKKENEDKED